MQRQGIPPREDDSIGDSRKRGWTVFLLLLLLLLFLLLNTPKHAEPKKETPGNTDHPAYKKPGRVETCREERRRD